MNLHREPVPYRNRECSVIADPAVFCCFLKRKLHDFNDFLLISFFSRGGIEAPLAAAMEPVVVGGGPAAVVRNDRVGIGPLVI
jgi:hypothetical protein